MFEVKAIQFGRATMTADKPWFNETNPSLYRIHCVLSGNPICAGIRLLPGHLYLFPVMNFHDCELYEPYDHMYFDFFSIAPIKVDDVIDIDLAENTELRMLCESITAIFTNIPRNVNREFASALLETLLGLIDYVNPICKITDPRILSAIKYIDEHYSEGVTLDELARLTNTSKFWFVKLFKNEVGQTPLKFINTMRFNYAIKMLNEGKTVSYVAEKVGFSSITAFSKAFSKRYLRNPSYYRNL